jgi:quaternary ammonium compound-resistance protein SugE
MAWIYLFVAGLLEMGFTTSLRYTEGFTKPVPTLIFVSFMAASLYCVSKAAEAIPLGTAYAIWGGMGAVGTALIGIFYFHEPADLPRLLFLTLLIGSIVGLKFVSPH